MTLSSSQTVPSADGRYFFLLATPGFLSEVPHHVKVLLLDRALIELTEKVTWVVFCPEAVARRKEDQGRTVVYPLQLLDQHCRVKVYAILDDYGSVAALEQSAKRPLGTQFVLTFLLPEEY